MQRMSTHSSKEYKEDEAGHRKDQDCNRRDLDFVVMVACNSTVSELETAAGEMRGDGRHIQDTAQYW